MASTAHETGSPDPATPGTPDSTGAQEAAAWITQLLRTLKTCRLYDEANPTVVRFREELAHALDAQLAHHGAFRIEVGPNTLSLDGATLHSARSRDDNLAGVLHRDGIRLLVLEPGIDAREVNALVDQILKVTGPSPGEDDLVTLLWDADVPHITMETVPLEGDADGGAADDSENAPAIAWPKQDAGPASSPEPASTPSSGVFRSDDCETGESPAGLELAFDQLETVALFEIARFQQEHELASNQSPVTGALQFVEDCLANDLTADDRSELASFIPRILREALVVGDWRAASTTLRHLHACDPQWSAEEFARGLCGQFSVTTEKVVDTLDAQDQAGIDAFFALAREMGPAVAEWLMHVLAESQQMRVRRPLARLIAELLSGHPDWIQSWLTDGRWYVVRNVVHILGWIGGPGIVGGLQVASAHPEPRVRREVVAALSGVAHDASRPILTRMLATAEPDLFGTILHLLAADHDPSVANVLLELMRDKEFPARPSNERRAVFLALATRGESVVPALEAELNAGGLFSMRTEPDYQGIALCIARIGTPAARAVLERGMKSGRAAVRKSCMIAGESVHGDE
jgi:hypothetical protein